MLTRVLLGVVALCLALAVVAVGLLGFAVAVTYPKLPDLAVLTDYRPKIPLRIYTADGVQIGEFGEERRSFTKIQDVPQLMKQAIMAAEAPMGMGRMYGPIMPDTNAMGRMAAITAQTSGPSVVMTSPSRARTARRPRRRSSRASSPRPGWTRPS